MSSVVNLRPARVGRAVLGGSVEPVTAAEVVAMFDAAGCDVPPPKELRCQRLADFLSALISENRAFIELFSNAPGAEAPLTFKQVKRRRDAIGLLKSAVARDRAACGQFAGPVHQEFWTELNNALVKAETLLAPQKTPGEPWHEWSFKIAYVMKGALSSIGHRYNTVSENNKVSHITQMALARLGYPKVTRGAIAKHYQAEIARGRLERTLPPGGDVL